MSLQYHCTARLQTVRQRVTQRLQQGLLWLGLAVLPATPSLATNVIITTDLGEIEIELFDEATPLTVANFLKYIADGDFVDSFVHRSVPGFVIQGGGYTFTDETGVPVAVPTDPAITNEPGISNTRGTIAMAKFGGQPDSATSQWFINTADNISLDTSNGGFTVFGQVVRGMDVVDAINALQIWNAQGAFAELPLIDYSQGIPITSAHLVNTEFAILEDFLIHAGLNDAWVSDVAPLQGMFVTVFESLGLVFVAWFTFDSVPPPAQDMAVFGAADTRWVTGLGTIDGNRVVLSAELTSGGAFNTGSPLPQQQAEYGTITLMFSGCAAGEVQYAFPSASLSGSFAIHRVLDSNVANCEARVTAE